MKQKIYKVLLVLFITLIITIILHYKVFDKNNNLNYVTAFQYGVYQNSTNAYTQAKKYNGIVIKDEDIYRVYIAAYQDDDIIERMNSYYKKQGIYCHLKQIRVDDSYIQLLNKYESMLYISSDESIIPNLNNYLITSLESHI